MTSTATAPIGAEGRYWDALREGRLELPQCEGCGRWHWPAVFRCADCGSWDHRWEEQPLTGTVFTWTRTHHDFGGTAGIAKPFVTAIVALDTVPVRLTGIVTEPSEGIGIGAPVAGSISATRFMTHDIPSIRWAIAA
ncbi:MAG: zinc ribbon domain-containing protein [Parasphingopyxis sp.]|uniref:Zn-ribbon domain-containing OB-fold protein n=1 Tax=Parasphingopyxis sp. TaxID=1920299 RepID=UPI0032EB0E0B